MTCAQALKHPWFKEVKKEEHIEKKLDPSILNSLKNYQGISRLRKEAMNVFVKMLKQDEIENLREYFVLIDKD